MKLDNKISLGNVIAICTFIGGIIFAGGKLTANIETLHQRASTALEMANENQIAIDDIDNRLIVIETKLDDGFASVIKAIKRNK